MFGPITFEPVIFDRLFLTGHLNRLIFDRLSFTGWSDLPVEDQPVGYQKNVLMAC